MQLGGSSVALVVALVSLSSIAVSTLRDQLHEKSDEIRAEFVSAKIIHKEFKPRGASARARVLPGDHQEWSLEIDVLVSNSGDAAGWISKESKELKLYLGFSSEKEFKTQAGTNPLAGRMVTSKNTSIEPGEFQILTFSTDFQMADKVPRGLLALGSVQVSGYLDLNVIHHHSSRNTGAPHHDTRATHVEVAGRAPVRIENLARPWEVLDALLSGRSPPTYEFYLEP